MENDLNPVPKEKEEHSSDAQEGRSSSTKQFLKEIIQLALLALLIVVPIRMYVASPFLVHGASMVPTFQSGDYLIIDQLSYKFDNPKRGDVIVFHYPKNPSVFFIKRIIGLPGETISLRDEGVYIFENEVVGKQKLEEPYVENIQYDNMEITLGENEYFVLGDNRDQSADSRTWGPLEKDLITGKAFVRLFPFTNIDVHPGEYSY